MDEGLVNKKTKLVPASKEKRFANFLVDYFAIIVGVSFFYLVVDGMGYDIEPSEDMLKERFQGMIFYITYYLLFEGVTGGKSLGKMLTKTRVLTLEGNPPEVGHILGRSLIRIVPFEPFSFLGKSLHGWHDRWSKTVVIDETQSVFEEAAGWEEEDYKEKKDEWEL